MHTLQSKSVSRQRLVEESPPEPEKTRQGWRAAVASLRSAAYRLHHYRNIRSQMLGDALRRLDCCR